MNGKILDLVTDNAFDQYQKWAKDFIRFPIRNLVYPALKLNGEAGEIAEKVGKLWRDNDVFDWPFRGRGISLETLLSVQEQYEIKTALIKELGDVLWYISAIATVLGTDLSSVAAANIDKLESRQARGTLAGSGDDR